MSKKRVLVLGCSMTLHHETSTEPIAGVRGPGGDYPYTLSELFPNWEWYNFGKGGSSNFEYVRRISTFIEHRGKPDFVLVQLTYAERMLLEFHNYKTIQIETTQTARDNYFVVQEKNLREHGAYISGYNIYSPTWPKATMDALRSVTALHLTSTFHAWRFWENHFLIQSLLERLNIPHLIFLTHPPVHMPRPPAERLPLDFSTTLDAGKTSLYEWFESRFGPYDSHTIGNGDWHLKMDYNKAVAQNFLFPHLENLLDK